MKTLKIIISILIIMAVAISLMSIITCTLGPKEFTLSRVILLTLEGVCIGGTGYLLSKWIDKTPVIAILCILSFMAISCSYRGYKAHLFKPDKSTNLVKACSKTDKLTSHDVSKTMKYYYKQKR